jgi:hypothetical protein
MDTVDAPFSRISKLLVDRDETSVEEALAQRRQFAVTLRCGADVALSYTLQLAVLSAANIASRCFPGAVRFGLPPGVAEAPLLIWPGLKQTFGGALASVAGPDALVTGDRAPGRTVIFGNADPIKGAMRVTFDGWIAKVGPAAQVKRMAEREYCPLAGVLVAALALSELFLSFTDISVEAGRRTLALSLWKPDVAVSDPSALGIPVKFLPRELWILGLGHLGNAYLWCLASLPYSAPDDTQFFLNDFDDIEDENVETSLLFEAGNIGGFKTRACNAWLEARRFQTRLIERRFDGNFCRRDDEPGLALCGFDSNPARRDLAAAEFLRVIESGLGGTPNNFDTISLHTLPNPRPVNDLWPDLAPDEAARIKDHEERIARENAAYMRIGGNECGRYGLAGKSIAVPFVGAAAATLVVAEILRLLHRGPAYTGIKLSMSSINARAAKPNGNYSARDFVGLNYTPARTLEHP